MKETKSVITKKSVIKNCLLIFFWTILFAFVITMIGTNGKPFAEGETGKILFYAILPALAILFVLILVVGFITYKFANKHPETTNKINSPKGKRYTSIFIILFGAYLILSVGYSYFIINPPIEVKFVLIRIGFGILAIIWGIYYLIKSKSKN
jgi:hypothetical protein